MKIENINYEDSTICFIEDSMYGGYYGEIIQYENRRPKHLNTYNTWKIAELKQKAKADFPNVEFVRLK